MEVYIMTYEEQTQKICDKLDSEVKKIKQMPRNEAKKYAIAKLYEIGICNRDGSLAKLYGGKN